MPLRSPSQRNQPAAIVVGLDCMTGLQTARILSRYGIPVTGIAGRREHPCSHTNVCESVRFAEASGEGLMEHLRDIASSLSQKAVLVPCTDASVLQISRHRQELGDWYRIALPHPDVLEMLTDKNRFYRYAKEKGLPVPATFFLRDRGDAERAALEIEFPCVLKPALKTPRWESHTKAKAYKIGSRAQLLSVYESCSGWTDALILQRWVQGGDSNLFSCNCYFSSESRALATFVSRKLRQWPIEAGTSCFGQECRNDVVLEQAIRLFEEARLFGLGYLEMKMEDRTGRYFIIEPNIGRPTGRSALAEHAGVELLYTMYCDLVGIPLPEHRQQRYRGQKWVYLRRDLQASAHYWRRGELTLREWLQSMRGPKVDALFSLRDPLPFLLDWKEAAGRVWRGQTQKAHRLTGVQNRRLLSEATKPSPARSPQSSALAAYKQVDYDIHGIVGVRLINPSKADAAAVRRQLGPLEAPLLRDPDITVRFVERLPVPKVTYVDVAKNGSAGESFYILQSGKREAKVRVAFEQIGQSCEIVCQTGASSVPLLLAIVSLTALKKGHVALHASAFVHQNTGVLVTGWAKGGKTEALLAFAAHGARYVGDEWILLQADGAKMYGIPENIRIWDWHLEKLPHLKRHLRWKQRMVFAGIHGIDCFHRWLASGLFEKTFPAEVLRSAMPALHRQLNITLDPNRAFGELGQLWACPEKVFLMASHQNSGIEIEPADPVEIARRMASSVRYEQLPLMQQYFAFRFAFPDRRSDFLEQAHEVQYELLCRALAGKEAYIVKHPYPVSLQKLYEAMRPFVEGTRRVAAPRETSTNLSPVMGTAMTEISNPSFFPASTAERYAPPHHSTASDPKSGAMAD